MSSSRFRVGHSSALRVFVAAFAVSQPFATIAEARVTRLEIAERQPTGNDRSFGSAGTYEVLRGRVVGEIDPDDPHNRIIQDIRLAPRNARGKVEYVATF